VEITTSIRICYLVPKKQDKMKKILKIITMVMLSCPFSWAEDPTFDEQAIETAKTNLWNQVEGDYTTFLAADNVAKQGLFSGILNDIAGSLLSKQWVYSGGGDWPVVDWNLVDKMENFFEDQDKDLLYDSEIIKIAQDNEEAAKAVWLVHLLSVPCSDGETWYGDWLQNIAKGGDTNLKRIVYRSVEDFGEDRANKYPDQEPVADWNAWKQSYDQSNQLGKAILLKCMTRLALITEDWDKLKQIHLSVFNGNDDALKAIALIKGNSKLGDDVIVKWTDLAENSTNAKLKSLAEQVVARHTGEVESLE